MAKPALFKVNSDAICPQCGAALVIRTGKHGPFQGCSAYPECDYVRPLNQADGHIIKILEEQFCPVCQSALVLRQGRFGMFIGCSSYPECIHTEMLDKPDDTMIACPQCHHGHLVMRRSRYGKNFWSCSTYPACQFVVNSQPRAGTCPTCGYPLLIEKKTARGVVCCCASKLCGKPLPAEQNRE